MLKDETAPIFIIPQVPVFVMAYPYQRLFRFDRWIVRGGSLAALFMLVLLSSGCELYRFHAIQGAPAKLQGVDAWPLYRNTHGENAREVQLCWPVFKYQRVGEERLLRVWPLYYRHTGDRLLGLARFQDTADKPVHSDIFAIQEYNWEGSLSSLALYSCLGDRYSSSRALLHPSVLMLHLEHNRRYWPQGKGSQPSGLYTMWIPLWYVDYLLGFWNRDAAGGLHHYFPPVVGYDGYAGEFKLLNLYLRRDQIDMLPPVAGVGFGQTSRTYLWPFFSRVNVDGKVESNFLWMGFSHQGYWCPAWVWSTKEEVQAKKAS